MKLLTQLNQYYASPLLLACLWSCQVEAQTKEATLAMSITPQLCILEEEQTNCQLDVVVSWDYDSGPVCISSDLPTLAQWCSTDAQSRSHSFSLNTNKDIHFVLLERDSGKALANVDFKTVPVSENPVRRRYRNPWSLFR